MADAGGEWRCGRADFLQVDRNAPAPVRHPCLLLRTQYVQCHCAQ